VELYNMLGFCIAFPFWVSVFRMSTWIIFFFLEQDQSQNIYYELFKVQ